jgi:glycosyltransferase involved in cell wall biosynthesis
MRVNGISFDPDSIEELGHALLLLDSHPELRDTLGANSRRIIAGYSCDNFARNALLAVGAALGEKFEQPAKMTARILQAEPTSTSR